MKRLLAEQITSVEQLEVLLLLRERAGEAWTARAVSAEIRTSERSAATRLADLSARGFLVAESGTDAFRYAPSHAGLAAAVDRLAAAYRERRYTIIDLIFSKPIANLRVYADAFRFRKDDKDG